MFLRILTAWAFRSSLGKGNSLPEVWVTSSKNACSAFRKASLSFGKCSQTCIVTFTIRAHAARHKQEAGSHRCCQASGTAQKTSTQGAISLLCWFCLVSGHHSTYLSCRTRVHIQHGIAILLSDRAVIDSDTLSCHCTGKYTSHRAAQHHSSRTAPAVTQHYPRSSKMLCSLPGMNNVIAACQCCLHPNCACE